MSQEHLKHSSNLTSKKKISDINIAEKVKDIRGLPSVAVKLLALIADDKVSTTEIEQIMSNDASILARLLRIANSPIYKRKGEIHTAREAIMMLGTKVISFHILFAALKDYSRKPSQITKRIWEHTLAVATASELLAKHMGISPDLAKTAGLLHDIGSIVIDGVAPKSISVVVNIIKKYPMGNACVTDIEQELLGTDHCEIGAEVAKKWNIPDIFIPAIEKHHKYFFGTSGVMDIMLNPLLTIVTIANCIACLNDIAIYKSPKCTHDRNCAIYQDCKRGIEAVQKKFHSAYQKNMQILFG
jgi:putative nucleotidyltransferase with HDIG domain